MFSDYTCKVYKSVESLCSDALYLENISYLVAKHISQNIERHTPITTQRQC